MPFFFLSPSLPFPSLSPPPAPAPPPLQTQMGATVMLLARSCTLAKWISDSEMMAGWQWITDGGGFNVCNPCPSITELSFFRGDHHSSLLLFFPFPFFFLPFFLTQSSSLLEHWVSAWERWEIALHYRRALIRYEWIAGPIYLCFAYFLWKRGKLGTDHSVIHNSQFRPNSLHLTS